MNINKLVFSLILFLSPLTALAGGGHGHGHSHSAVSISQSQAETTASKRVAILIEKEKINANWKSVAVANAEVKMNGDHPEWVVTYKNSKASDPSRSTLYIFLSATGKYIAANFSGK